MEDPITIFRILRSLLFLASMTGCVVGVVKFMLWNRRRRTRNIAEAVLNECVLEYMYLKS